MILKKLIINGNEVFEPISYDDALEYNDSSALIFTNEDEKDEFYDCLEDKKEKLDDYFDDVKEKISDFIDDAKEKRENNEDYENDFSFNDFGNFFKKDFSSFKDIGLYNNITGALPFMDDKIFMN